MRIFAVTPIHVGPDELERRQARYDSLVPSGVTLDLVDIGPDAPRALETADDIRASEAAVIAALRSAPTGYDVLLPDCVLDPGVEALSTELPVVGILKLALGWQVLMGRRAGVVARNEAIATELMERATAYGWKSHVTGVEVLGLGVEAIADHAQWDDALTSALRRFDETTSTVVNGCSAVPVEGDDLGLPVLDPTALALRLLAAGEAR
ncbi:MAG TPA: aspartate/glutamate racemase family protein [Pedococcus sp.]|nr:aspartate/glutamate racemase family protein [Pedococcus sp.]